ncbi:OV-16 antigen [Neolecta irregularis DAH-3]|uniref:OV-16 antigen n=1 Tax=Neolecta irregularis (strain DAH-3) TaxID=1198029 RepID=A0A1U7LJI4_NEOID|nr:OV-16 antigen [Neolecta irregularis DAH-3]|eukprot:OLL22807.1 OV-16 antigen [Neolecta irregularis DAH-3]
MPLFTASSSSVAHSFVKEGIVPDVIHDINPKVLVLVRYGEKDVGQGEILSVHETQERPRILLVPRDSSPDNGGKYTVVLADPDAPSRADPKWRNCAHWVHSGLSLSMPESLAQTGNTGGTNLSEGNEILEYTGPAPTEATGLHRYCFLVFKAWLLF